MADVVGKTIFSDNKGKLYFGYYKDDDGVTMVDYKTWKKLSFKDVSKGDTNKERVIKAILKNQKQFNKKVEFNMWSKKNNPSFEQKMDWFIQNGWINNINKGGIKESVNEIQYKDAVAKFNDELIKHPMVKKAAQHYKKTPAEIVKVLQQRLSTKGNRGGDTKEVSIDFKDTDSGITVKHKKSFNESVNERYTGNSGDKLKHKYDKNIEIELIEPTNKGWKVYQTDKGNKRKITYFDKQDIVGNKSLFESVNEAGEDVNKAMLPGDVKIKLQKALDVLNGKKLTYPQKLQVLGRVLDSMGIGKGELNKVSQKLRTKLESVNEATSSMSKEIALMTGTRQPAVQQFIDKHNINGLKLAMYLNKQGLRGRMDFTTALSGKPGNPAQNKIIKMFQESVNEAINKDKFNKAVLDSGKLTNNVYLRTDEILDSILAGLILDKGISGAKKYVKELTNLYKSIYIDLPKYESVNEGISVSDERHFGKGGIIIMIDDNGKKVSAIFKDKKNADKYNRNNPSDIKKLLDLAKKTKYPNAIDESVNEAKFGYTDSTSSYINKHNNEYKIAERMNRGNEQKFYDDLQAMEDKIGYPKTMKFISNALRGYKVDMFKDPKIKNPADAQEALFLLSK